MNNPDPSKCQDSDSESDPGPAGSKDDQLCSEIVYESDTKVVDNARSPAAAKHIHYEGTGQVI